MGPWPTTYERWRVEGLPEGNCNTLFNMDPLVHFVINGGLPYYPWFENEVVEETDVYRIRRGNDGILMKEFKNRGDTSMPQFLRFPMTDRADWERVRERLNPADAKARIGDASNTITLAADPTVATMLPICGAFGHLRNLFGDEGLAYILYDDPALVEEIMDGWLALFVAMLRELTGSVRLDVLMIWEDMCYRNGPLIGPAHVDQFMMPRYRELIAEVRRYGVAAVIVDTDGDCRSLIPLFLANGVDALLPFEVQAGMDVAALAREFPTMGIVGGLDKRALAGTRDDIRREVDRVMPNLTGRGGFIPALDHTVPPNVSLANFRYYLECLREYEEST